MHAFPPQYQRTGMNRSCEDRKQTLRDHIAYLKKAFPRTNASQYHEDKLQRIFCPHNIFIWNRSRAKSKGVTISPLIDGIGNSTDMRVIEKPYPKGENLKSLIQKKCFEEAPTEIYFDQQGKGYYGAKAEFLTRFLSSDLGGLKLGYTGDTSHLNKRYVGLGRNLHAMVERGEREYVICDRNMHFRKAKNPENYYTVTFHSDRLLVGDYFAVDINNPDGSSSFLTK